MFSTSNINRNELWNVSIISCLVVSYKKKNSFGAPLFKFSAFLCCWSSGVITCWMLMETLTWMIQWMWPAMSRSCFAGQWPASGAVSSPEPAHMQLFCLQKYPHLQILQDCNQLKKCPGSTVADPHYNPLFFFSFYWRTGKEDNPLPDLRYQCVYRESTANIRSLYWHLTSYALVHGPQVCHMKTNMPAWHQLYIHVCRKSLLQILN